MLRWDGRIERKKREHYSDREGQILETFDLRGVRITLSGGRVSATPESGKAIHGMNVYMETICFDPGGITFEAYSQDDLPDRQLYPHWFRWTLWPQGAETILRELWGLEPGSGPSGR
jgi:hypothetical protein